MRYNTESFIKRAQEVHGNKYDYSLVDYVRSRGKVKIVCPIHGVFEQRAAEHLSGKGCVKCASTKSSETKRRKNSETFIERSRNIHGDFYDYSETIYTDSRNKVTIICPIHGAFQQVAAQHLFGSGCPLCARERTSKKMMLKRRNHSVEVKTQEDFILKAREIHGFKYNYEKVCFNKLSDKICIICPEHGEFFQTVRAHLKGNGCIKCARKIVADKKKKNTEWFVKQAREVQGNRYDYSRVIYRSCKEPVRIICREHGEFMQSPTKHLCGHNCPVCSAKSRITTRSKNKEWFLNKARLIHGEKYDYSEADYISCMQEVKIVCHERDKEGNEHGAFWMTPNRHLDARQGCPICGRKHRNSEDKLYGLLLKRFPSCNIIREHSDKRTLGRQRLDFFFPEYKIGIEYQGPQHFNPNPMFGGEKEFVENVKRDTKKHTKCQKHGIKLFYFTFNPLDVSEGYFEHVFSDFNELAEEIEREIEGKRSEIKTGQPD